MQPITPGTQIMYSREDSGGNIQNDNETVSLTPGKPLTVSVDPAGDVSPALAARLVEDGVCRVYSLPPVESTEDHKPTEDKARPAEDHKPEEQAQTEDHQAEDHQAEDHTVALG